jgi:hypothetical protein
MSTVLAQFNAELTLFIAINVITCIWLLYLFFYNSKLTGFIATKVANKWILRGNAYIKIGVYLVRHSACGCKPS